MPECPKVLSVTFGAFSCTLEGFDDPVETLRQVADHFHHLASRDHGFSAQAPASDTDLLQHLAESASDDEIEAHILDGTITLRHRDDPHDPVTQVSPDMPIATDLFAEGVTDDLDECEPIDDGSAADDPTPIASDEDTQDSVAAFLAGLEYLECPERTDARTELPEIDIPNDPELTQDEDPTDTIMSPIPDEDDQDEETSRRDAAMDRLMSMAAERLEDAEGHRRRSAINHLRAAVAATRADEQARDQRDARVEDRTGPFRNDLDRAVRPSRPAPGLRVAQRPRLGAVADRLVLAATQRVDEEAVVTAPTRPRRVASELATSDDRDFPDFARRVGASDLPDLFEAAAAYSQIVEGRDGTSRPTILRRAGHATADAFSRQRGLELFDDLVRAGRLREIERGRYGLAENAPMIDRARASAD
ncbi:hypothetical protein [Palleronia sp. LCG004]|uniref:hypothetical protein n=1 Tax=Palleronia sp. LCG004 TaxID=3079304 RepID=UPI0029434F8D|nr:hypothetical protein [Palleronia sp. LCG004]WOI55660.1 hypothetical protein RVY76_11495 [Palleronia sp. LCG004]